MVLKKIIVFIVDDVINIVYKAKVINIRLKDVVNKGMIVNKAKFIEEFMKVMKKEKIKTKLFGDNIVVVKNSFYNYRDLFYLESIFNDLGFLQVEFLDIRELLKDKDVTFVEINNSYLVINLKEGIFLDLDYFKDVPKIIEYFKDAVSDVIILFGVNKNIPKFKVKNKEVYYYDNYVTYITDCLLKVNKNDA